MRAVDVSERSAMRDGMQMSSREHPAGAPARKIEDIQILRAVAILLVLAQHFSVPKMIFGGLFPGFTVPFRLGVDLFFVISGFVVTASVLDRPPSPVRFVIRRAFRLLPAILCFLAFSAALSLSAWLLPVSDFGKANIAGTLAGFARDAFGIVTGTLIVIGQSSLVANGAMWSLSVEFQFYFVFALLIAACARMNALRFRQAILAVAVAIYAVMLASRVAGPYLGFTLPPLLKYLVFWQFDFLLLGVIGAAGLRPVIGVRSAPYGRLLAPLLLLAALALYACGEEMRFEYIHERLRDGVLMPAIGLLFLGVVLLASNNRAFAGHETAAYRFTLWIGELSYSMYLFHFATLALFWVVLDLAYPSYLLVTDHLVVQLVVCVSLTIAISALVFHCVEMPLNRYGAALAAGRQPRAPVSA